MTKLDFCQRFVHLDGRPISFADRPYLPAIYADGQRNLVLRCSRQTEKSTFLVNTILYEACKRPGIKILFVCPRLEQAQFFSRSRLLATLQQSPVIRRSLLGQRGRTQPVMNLRFRNGSELFVRAAFHSGDACRGLSADLLLVDEFQDVAEGDLPVLRETLSHARQGRTILTGTPKSIDNHLETMYRHSTAHEWTVDCPGCQRGVILDERALGPAGMVCPTCAGALDPRLGAWQPRNPTATWGAGYWIGHPMVPWLNYDEILERQRTYDIGRFKNEVLGLSTTSGDYVVTRAELEACCGRQRMAQTAADLPGGARHRLVAGIDWGGGGQARSVLVIGSMRRDFTFQVHRFERFAGTEDPRYLLDTIAQRCQQFDVRLIAADGGGNGHVLNRLLLDRVKLPRMCAILYSDTDHQPTADGTLMKWSVSRSASIGVLFSRVKKQRIEFPQVADCGSFLDEFACQIAEFNDHARTIRYVHPPAQQDDALHATNYALLLAVRAFQQGHQYG